MNSHPRRELLRRPLCRMFARQRRPGWTAWGNELDKFEPDYDAHDDFAKSLEEAIASFASALRPAARGGCRNDPPQPTRGHAPTQRDPTPHMARTPRRVCLPCCLMADGKSPSSSSTPAIIFGCRSGASRMAPWARYFSTLRSKTRGLDAFAADAAILVSLLLQHSTATPAEIGHALRRAPDGTAASLVGAVVDRLAEMGRPQS